MAGQIITVEQHGEFKKTQQFFEKCLNVVKLGHLDSYGKRERKRRNDNAISEFLTDTLLRS